MLSATEIEGDGAKARLFEEPTASPRACEHCGHSFAPRAGSGGRPQRFCSPECRAGFHAANRGDKGDRASHPEPQRDQRSAPHVGLTGKQGAPGSEIANPAKGHGTGSPSLEQSIDRVMHSGGLGLEPEEAPADEDRVIGDQPETWAYANVAGHVAIRQCGMSRYQDHQCVVVLPEHVDAFCARLKEIAAQLRAQPQ